MSKEIRNNFVEVTSDFMACNNVQANEYVDRWIEMAKTEVQTQELQEAINIINNRIGNESNVELLKEKSKVHSKISNAYGKLANILEKQEKAKTARTQRQIGYEMTKLKATRNELQGEEMLKDILLVASERVATKED